MVVEVNTEVSRSLLTLVHIMYLLLFLFLLARRSYRVLCLGLERGLKPLPNEFRIIIIRINLASSYQLLLNCNKVHMARLKKDENEILSETEEGLVLSHAMCAAVEQDEARSLPETKHDLVHHIMNVDEMES
jgi:hypothetical protein